MIENINNKDIGMMEIYFFRAIGLQQIISQKKEPHKLGFGLSMKKKKLVGLGSSFSSSVSTAP